MLITIVLVSRNFVNSSLSSVSVLHFGIIFIILYLLLKFLQYFTLIYSLSVENIKNILILTIYGIYFKCEILYLQLKFEKSTKVMGKKFYTTHSQLFCLELRAILFFKYLQRKFYVYTY